MGRYSEIVECAMSVEVPREAPRNKGIWEPRQTAITGSSSSGTFGSQGRKRQREPSSKTQGPSIVRASTIFSGVRRAHSRPAAMCHRSGQPSQFHVDCQTKAYYVCGEFTHLAKNCPRKVVGARSSSSSLQQQGSGLGFGQQSFRANQRQQKPYFRQTTTIQDSQIERGASSSTPTQASGQRGGFVQSQTTRGRAFAIISTVQPP
ncbi:uncharacterized protein LOC131331086 [Rhododendron vialii]|uniref:uncharacterized protein LOC131331086 n=1 Tax=Rhododendron vialii TaxID=182163 RepID=UPI00265E9D06|nr:uncharacterized protein LOC131331086 [Rhododendron vialii]